MAATVQNSSTVCKTQPPDRQRFREAVAAMAAKAHAKLPACNGRIDSAVKMVLAGDVELLAAGGARVASRTDATVQYHLANGQCDCRDYARAPEHLCAHRLAYGIARRVHELLPQSPPVETEPEPVIEVTATPVPPLPAAPAAPLPEAAFSLTLKGTVDGHEALLTARGQTPAEFRANLAAIRGLLDPAPAQAQPAASSDAPQCPNGHGALKKSTKGKGWYCTTKRPDGTWCPGK